jgi:clan AA aspartic protease
MATLYGSLDNSRSAFITIAVSAPSGASHFVDALIDTGFTGFVQLPERHARALGLTLGAVSEVEYADGRTGTIPLAWARVGLGRDSREELIHVQRGSDEVIVGMELLRIFQKILVVSIVHRLVLLTDTLEDLYQR